MEFGFRLRDAAEAGKLDKVIRELENGTPIDCTSYAAGKSALHIASAHGHHEIVKVLLERGANVEAKDAMGETPLHLAVAAGRAKCVVELLRNGADAWAHKNAQGKSAYAQAQELAKNSNSADGKLVLQAFSDVYDMGGSTAADPSEPPRWTPDERVSECQACKDAFTLVRRKHHCRHCGGVFCQKCSSGSIPLIKFNMLQNQRVCDACFAAVMAESGGLAKGPKSPRGGVNSGMGGSSTNIKGLRSPRHERKKSSSSGNNE